MIKIESDEFQELIERIKEAEGFSCTPYFDRTHYTWGYGTRAPTHTGEITKQQAHKELVKELKKVVRQYNNLFKKSPFPINKVRRLALCDMIYNLGFYGFTKFERMLKLIFNNNPDDWDKIAQEAANSKWYKQVGKRAERIYYELKRGTE